MSKTVHDNIVNYTVNDSLPIETECRLCREIIVAFNCESFKVEVGVKYVGRDTFETLASELYEFKSYATNIFTKMEVNKDKDKQVEMDMKLRQYEDKLRNITEKNKTLEKDINNKEKLIDLLLQSSNVMNQGNSSETNYNFKSDVESTYQNVDNKLITVRRKPAYRRKRTIETIVPTENRFNGLQFNDDYDFSWCISGKIKTLHYTYVKRGKYRCNTY